MSASSLKMMSIRIAAMAALAVCGVVTGGGWLYWADRQRVLTHAEESLLTIADLKVGNIAAWRDERLADAAVLSESPFLREKLKQFLTVPLSEDVEEMRIRLQSLRDHYHYHDVCIVDPAGGMRFSLTGEKTSVTREIMPALAAAFGENRAKISDLYRVSENAPPHVDVVAPIVATEGGVSCAIVLECDAQQFLYKQVEAWPTPSASAEVLLVRREGDSVLFLNDLRFRPDTALKLRIPVSQTNVPAVKAVLGQQGIVWGVDYRGVPVLSALRPIPNSPWYMVAKIDQKEALSGWRTTSVLILAAVCLLVAGIGLLTVALFQRYSRQHYEILYRTEMRRQEVEARYGAILMGIGDGVITTDARGNVELLNPVAETLTGWTQEEARGRPLTEIFRIISETTRETVENPVAEVIAKGIVANLANHTLLVARDGTERPIADSGAPVRNEHGELTGVVLVFRDQSLERAHEMTLHEREEMLRVMTGAASSAFLMVDEEGLIVFYNPAAEQIFGWTAEEAMGQVLLSLLAPERYRAAFARGMERFRQSGQGAAIGKTLELAALRKDGSEFPVEISLSSVYMRGAWHGVGIVLDITERKEAEAILQASEEKYRALVETTGTGYLILDMEGKVIDANREYVRLTGRRDRQDILGRSVTEWTAEYEKERNEDAVARCVKDGFVKDLIIDYVDSSNRITPVEINATVVGTGASCRIISLCRDITERRRAEEEQRRAYRREGVINGILSLSLTGESLESTLARALELIVTAPDLEITKQGAVFLVVEGMDTLVLCAHRGLAKPLQTACAQVPFGWCLCGRAAVTGDVQFASCIDDRHDVMFEGMRPHGHVCVPMRIDKKTIGVLNLYVEEGQARDDKLERFLVAAADVLASVVARKKAENALRESEKRFMDVLYASNDAILLIRDETFVDCNEATARMLGFSDREQFLMTHPSELSPPTQPDGRSSFEKANEMMQMAFEKGFQRFEWIHRRVNGEDFPVEVSLTPISYQGKAVLHCLWRDLTAYKQAEQSLRQSEERHRALFNSATDAIMTIEPPSWKFTSGNPACVAMFGAKNEEEFKSFGPWELSPEYQPGGRPSGEQAQAAIETAMREGSHFFEWTHKRINGEEFPATVLLTRLEIGEHAFLQATVRDITEQKRMEVELNQAQKLESIGRLAAGIAHEINTPTQYVGDNIEFLQIAYDSLLELAKVVPVVTEAGRDSAIPPSLATKVSGMVENANIEYLSEQVPRAIEQSLEGVERIATIVQAMKEFSHPGVAEKTSVDLNQCIRSTTTVSHNEWKYVADIDLDLDDSLPRVSCLPGEFNQAILNMIVNAAHAISDVVGDDAERKGMISISTRLNGVWAEIRITDTGSGIPEGIRERIFDPFFTTKEVGRGTGQGLAIARNVIVDKHGGTLAVESEVGKGTTFIIRLPIESVALDGGSPPSDAQIG